MTMDEKTKDLVEELEAMAAEKVEFDAWYVVREPVPQICAIVREQDKRITELEEQQRQIIRACLGRDVENGLAKQVLGLCKSQSALNDRVSELETENERLRCELELNELCAKGVSWKCGHCGLFCAASEVGCPNCGKAQPEPVALRIQVAELERDLASAKAYGTDQGHRADKLAFLLAYATDTLENACDLLEDDDIDEETPAVREHIIEMWELLGNDDGIKRVKEAMAKAPRGRDHG
jgi:hypothetical protein